ncbi:DUF6370 family protein [Hymenobacter cellulosivorans]|uniref:DUF6370 family protein n=1 Tax=Hymenobacter cellulosivorans TaxID=2932249 RepID=A0ABY4F801_9BACT|nr:DUF6370 family protein [Hymenobacter cellulosivorans]UOQ52535.1 DUF6370 family protein [Hymenobacter cellulosivorans]
MKPLLFLLLLLGFSAVAARAQSAPAVAAAPAGPDKTREVRVVEAACGQCRLGLPGKSCDLAIRLDGKAYFVDGTTIDSHGDAHAKDGFCQTIRQAQVQGEIVDNRFKATSFQLLPAAPKGK